MSLTSKQRRFLRGMAHHLKPIILVGQHGLTEGVINELDIALEHHELVKVKIAGADRESRREMVQTMCERTESEAVQTIGNTATLFRQRDEDSDFELS